MTKYIFHGGGAGSDDFYAELVKEIPSKGTVLLVYFASRTDDNSDRIAYDTQKCKEFSLGKDIVVQVATLEGFEQQAAVSDAIYFRGGSTEKLINALKQFPSLKAALENKPKTVAGSSAGAYALSTLYSCHYEDRAAEGLGVVSVRVVTHYESKSMPPRERSVEMLRNIRNDLDLIVLREGEWKIFTTTN